MVTIKDVFEAARALPISPDGQSLRVRQTMFGSMRQLTLARLPKQALSSMAGALPTERSAMFRLNSDIKRPRGRNVDRLSALIGGLLRADTQTQESPLLSGLGGGYRRRTYMTLR